MKEYPLFINNEFVPASGGETFTTTSPATGDELAAIHSASRGDVETACRAARTAFQSGVWSRMDNNDRADILLKAADIVEARIDEFARAEALDTGKTITETRYDDIPLSIRAFRYFANLAREINGAYLHIPHEPHMHDYLVYDPYGVVAVIAPYNFPLHLLTRSLAPALAAGNTSVCKASSMTPLTTALLGEVIAEAGFPPGVVNIVAGPGRTVGEWLASDPRVDVVAFTGSESVGRRLLELSAASPIIKKHVLELGGKGPVIVEGDCRFEPTVTRVADGLLQNLGQVCCAQTRLILHNSIADRFLPALATEVGVRTFGDILDPSTQLGAMISESALQSVDAAVKTAVESGATLLCGGERYSEPPCDRGSFYRPTVLTNVATEMACYREEIFGPVLVVVEYDTIDEAIDLANDSPFGLGAGIFTENHKTAHYASHRLDAGSIFVNVANTSRMNAPFGGNRNSGFGREYGSAGLHEYLRSKNTFWDMNFGLDDKERSRYRA